MANPYQKSDLREKVYELYKSGLGVRRIAKIINRNQGLPAKWLRQAGLLHNCGARSSRNDRAILTTFERLTLESYISDSKYWKKYEAKYRQHRWRTKRINDFGDRTLDGWKRKVRKWTRRYYFESRRAKEGSLVREIIGLDPPEFRAYIDSIMPYKSMAGTRHGIERYWEFDHIAPLSLARSREELFMLGHWTNVRPCLMSENIRKSNSIDRRAIEIYEARVGPFPHELLSYL